MAKPPRTPTTPSPLTPPSYPMEDIGGGGPPPPLMHATFRPLPIRFPETGLFYACVHVLGRLTFKRLVSGRVGVFFLRAAALCLCAPPCMERRVWCMSCSARCRQLEGIFASTGGNSKCVRKQAL